MELIVKFEDILNVLDTKELPSYMYINVQDNDILEHMFPDNYDKAVLNEYWSHGKLGYLNGIPVLSGVLSRKAAKLIWN